VARYIRGWTLPDSPRRAELPRLRERGHQALAVMERHLSTRPWFTGDAYGVADIAPHAFVAADRRQRWQHAVLAGQREHVGGIDRRGERLDQRLSRRQRRFRELDRRDHVPRHRAAAFALRLEHRHFVVSGFL
jgi:glutathione S-transferase